MWFLGLASAMESAACGGSWTAGKRTMTVDELIDLLFPPTGSLRPTPEQDAILRHPQGPGWVLAGPGSGKTEVLALLVLRLLFVEGDPTQPGRVPPEAILITTFTEKAARNLEDRISSYRSRVIAQRPALATVDISKLRIGTLHGLCNDLLQEQRAPNYQNVRLMDELELSMFVYEQLSIVVSQNDATDRPFWTYFSYLFAAHEWKTTQPYLPSRWNRTAAMVKLFNRIVEDRASLPAMRAAGGPWVRLADLYDEYQTKLLSEHRCDFSHLQSRFLEFLRGPLGQRLLTGDQAAGIPGIQWVLVDEYQDTNLIQEEIYFTLAGQGLHNLVVVGDDDQALYRFRGGSVECMVTFDQACQTFLGLSAVARYPLVANFRSHPAIVDFCNDYITSFTSMALPGSRVPNKPALVPRSPISGAYPAVGQLRAVSVQAVADRFAETIRELVANGVVSDYNQCCLLLRSTKETPRNAAPYVAALRNLNIPVYNPRSNAFLDQEEVRGLLGALITLLDPQARGIPDRPRDLATLVNNCCAEYVSLAAANPPLAQYVAKAHANLEANPGKYLNANLQELVYYLLALPPFSGWSNDPVRRVRLARITALIESYSAMPVANRPTVSRGRLRASITYPGEIFESWAPGFYHLFFGYLARTGLNEEEDDDIIAPPGMVPVMTMHQAKGLQFPFVFVGHMGEQPTVSTAHRLESEFARFPTNPARSFARAQETIRAELDMIRQYYVAYSRAQWALVLMGTAAHFRNGRVPCGPDAAWLPSKIYPL